MSKRDNMAVPEGKGNVQVSELPEPITSQPTQAPAFTDPSERGRLAGGNGAAVRQFALEINSQAALDFLEGRQSRNPFQIRVGPERAGFSPGGLPPVIKGSDEPISLRAFVGSTRYYRLREADFRRRNPGKKAPVYYLGYGDKYLHRFSEVTRPKLSPKGQRWLDGTLRTLQDLIEDRRDKDPAAYAELERNDAAATDFTSPPIRRLTSVAVSSSSAPPTSGSSPPRRTEGTCSAIAALSRSWRCSGLQ